MLRGVYPEPIRTVYPERSEWAQGKLCERAQHDSTHAQRLAWTLGVGWEDRRSGERDLRYFPTQNVEKMISNTSSTYVAPVI